MDKDCDVCLFLEGTYPYVSGGVSQWTHNLILSQPDLTFNLTCILPLNWKPELRYKLPKNVTGINPVHLQKLPNKKDLLSQEEKKKLFNNLEVPLLNLQNKPTLNDLKKIIDILSPANDSLGEQLLLNSEEAWNMVQRMYLSTVGESSFLNFYWSWRGLLGSFYSILLSPLPKASIYHTLCTGYAGLFLTRAYLETGKPCMITEHGIYTNERRIEITSADWLNDEKSMNLSVERSRFERDLKDFWIDTFTGYSKMCYESSNPIITLYQGNKDLEIADGADPKKIKLIPNGINYEKYSKIIKEPSEIPTIAFIGRVVPIKDVKSFIRGIAILKEKIDNMQVWIIGPTDEDEDYFYECMDLIINYNLSKVITFKGKVNVEEILGKIDLIALTSISEAQPLVILEAGAVGIPSIATDVGACREIIHGLITEDPPLGQAGIICQLSNPASIADSMFQLLSNKVLYDQCSIAIKKRVETYYNEIDLSKAYKNIYTECFSKL